MNEKQLLDLKENMTKFREEKSQKEGELSYLMKELKSKHGAKTLEEAKKKLQSMKQKVETLNEQIQQGIDKLENEYEV